MSTDVPTWPNPVMISVPEAREHIWGHINVKAWAYPRCQAVEGLPNDAHPGADRKPFLGSSPKINTKTGLPAEGDLSMNLDPRAS